MTNGNSDRLGRIERLIELLGQRVDSNAQAIAANSTAIAEVRDTLFEAVGRTLRGIDSLRERAEEDRVNFRERLEQTDTAIASISSTFAILQQLLRDRNGEA